MRVLKNQITTTNCYYIRTYNYFFEGVEMGSIVIPNTNISQTGSPIIFLAGPIKGAPRWQDEAMDIILSKRGDVTIASPRRELKESLLPGLLKGDGQDFARQR